MMQKIKNYQDLWPLLALPVVGAIGWAIGRFMGSRKLQPIGEGQATEQTPEILPQKARAVEEVELPSGHALKNQPESPSFFYILLVPFLILATAAIILALHRLPVQSQSIVPGGVPSHGQAALQAWGCGSCHMIPGVTGATGTVGPTLRGLSDRSFIGGHLQNSPDNMIRWIMHPQQISPGVDMPDTGVPEDVARDMAAYLYSIR